MDIFDELAYELGVKSSIIKKILYIDKDKYYAFSIPKRNGKRRNISAPKKELKFIQRRVLNMIEKYYLPIECVTGFTKNRGIVINANKHLISRYVLNIDLKDFFDTINFGRVRGMFMTEPFNFSASKSTILAQIVCEGNKLPQGAPTSPIISNIIAYKMDKSLEKFCKYNHCKYSRYADDITISTNSFNFSRNIARKERTGEVFLSEKIKKIIEIENGFFINYDKVRFSTLMERQEITGLIVNEKINVNKKFIKDTRAILHEWRINGLEKAIQKFFFLPVGISKEHIGKHKDKYIKSVIGRINFIRDVRGKYDRIFLKYAKEFNELNGKETFCISELEEKKIYIEERICVIEEGEGLSQGTGTFACGFGIITSAHVLANKETAVNTSRDKLMKNKERFPLKDIFVNQKNIYETKPISIDMDWENFTKDIINFKSAISQIKSFEINLEYQLNIGTKVIVAGYPEFTNFEKTKIAIYETTISTEREYFDIKMKCIDKNFYHGMSGGPVLNENLELIGIIYAGHDDEINVNNGFIPIKDVINILNKY